MFKIYVSFICLIVFAFLFFPNGNVVVCKGGKSQGEFIKSESLVSQFNFDGVSFSLNEKEFENLLLSYNCKKVSEFDFDGIKTYYFYSKNISRKEVINGKKVNVHAVVKDGVVTVGVPFIYYGY